MVGHPSIELFKKCNEIMKGSYPGVVKAIPEQLGCTAFFPGGYGLWLNEENNDLTRLPQFPVGGIMAVSRCFDTVENYSKYLSEWKNEKCIHCSNMQGNFWQGLISIYAGARVDMQGTFFTNIYMGQYEDDKFKKKSQFYDKSIQCLREQIEEQKPIGIIAIGTKVSRLLSGVFTELGGWKNAKTSDFYYNNVDNNVEINISGRRCVVSFIYSPSMYNHDIPEYERYENAKIFLSVDIVKELVKKMNDIS